MTWDRRSRGAALLKMPALTPTTPSNLTTLPGLPAAVYLSYSYFPPNMNSLMTCLFDRSCAMVFQQEFEDALQGHNRRFAKANYVVFTLLLLED